MRILVTGGAGFIGSALVERLLAEGHTVDVVDDLSSGSLANLAEARAASGHQLTIHQLDVRSVDLAALIARRRPEVVYHLAGRPDPAAPAEAVTAAEVEVVGSLRVLEAARASGTGKVVVASGHSIYGEPAGRDVPIKESHPHRPVTAAGVAKRAVVEYLQVYRAGYDVEFTALALATVYGPRQAGGVVGRMCRALADGEPVPVDGDGRQTRDLVFVDDVVDAFARAASRGSGLVLNVGTGVETSVNALYGVISGVAGRGELRREPARPAGVRRMALDAARANLHLGWSPWTPLAEGAAATWTWAAAAT